MKLGVLNLALQAIELLRPIVVRIKKRDRNLAWHITDAANSNAAPCPSARMHDKFQGDASSATVSHGMLSVLPLPAAVRSNP